MKDYFLNDPLFASVLILEDIPIVTEYLSTKLHTGDLNSHTRIEIKTASDIESFANLVTSWSFEAASIDWELNGYHKGPEILDLLCRYQPEAAKIVFTKHAHKQHEALRWNADMFLVKPPGGDLEEYYASIKRGIRLGYARRIIKCLQQMRVTDLPNLIAGQLLDEKIEIMIGEIAHRAILQCLIKNEQSTELVELIKQRGWWCKFDAASYALLPWSQKLRYLTNYAKVSSDEISQILSVEISIIESILALEKERHIEDVSLLERADKLLSVLSYVLRLSGYNPDLMSYIWKEVGLYDKSLNRPPWDESGLAEYLKNYGATGLNETLLWIHDH